MDINIISKSWTKRCGLKVKLNEDEDSLIANDNLQTQDIAAHSYITNLFVQPFYSHSIVHAVVASEPQSMAELWQCRLGTQAQRSFRYSDTMDSTLHNALSASRQSGSASLSMPIQSEQDQCYSVCTPTSVVLSIHQHTMECNMS
jgi:hypothetical protein